MTMFKLPYLTDDADYVTARDEVESIKSTMHALQAEANEKASSATGIKKSVVTIEDLDEAEEMEKQASRAATRAELMQPSLQRAIANMESKRSQASKAIIDAAQVEHDRILAETYATVDRLASLSAEHRELVNVTMSLLGEPSNGRRWKGFSYGPPESHIARLVDWVRFVTKPR
jgi:cell division septum initiation protein DivIVA